MKKTIMLAGGGYQAKFCLKFEEVVSSTVAHLKCYVKVNTEREIEGREHRERGLGTLRMGWFIIWTI